MCIGDSSVLKWFFRNNLFFFVGRKEYHFGGESVWYGTLGFNVPLDTVYVISEMGIFGN